MSSSRDFVPREDLVLRLFFSPALDGESLKGSGTAILEDDATIALRPPVVMGVFDLPPLLFVVSGDRRLGTNMFIDLFEPPIADLLRPVGADFGTVGREPELFRLIFGVFVRWSLLWLSTGPEVLLLSPFRFDLMISGD